MRRIQAGFIRPAVVTVLLLFGCDGGEAPWELVNPGCPSCSIEMHPEWSSSPDNSYVDLAANLVELSDGRVLHESIGGDEIMVHDSLGSFIRTLGRNGDGPGEFRSIAAIKTLPSERIVVLDRSRLTTFEADFSLSGVSSLPVIVEDRATVVLSDSTIVVATGRAAREGGFQNRVKLDGTLLNSFDRGYRDRSHTFLGPGTEGTVWSAPQVAEPRFVVEQWDPETGMKLASIVREPDWFLAWTAPTPSNIEQPADRVSSPPAIIDLFQSRDGLLWVITRLTDSGAGSNEGGYGGRFDSILEAIDPISGEVVASHYSDEFLAGFTTSGRVYVLSDEATMPRLETFALGVEGG